jgi:hypothetical protein
LGSFNGQGSGFFNTARTGSFANGDVSGFFNTGISGPEPGFLTPTGIFSGDISGLSNMGTLVAGVFNLGPY